MKDLLPYTYGSTHPVHYNPANPAEAYLRSSSLVLPTIFLVLGLDVFAFGLQHIYDATDLAKALYQEHFVGEVAHPGRIPSG